jgi:hypothetical protein
MKTLLPYLFILSVAFLSLGLRTSHSVKPKLQESFDFKADSGYILKTEGLRILKISYGKDTAYAEWNEALQTSFNDYAETDTLGKYYKNASGNIFACLILPAPAHLIAEITPNGDVIKSEAFGGGSHLCCMNRLDDAFRKKGNYFIVKTCATGSSAFCASYIYPFKHLISQEEMGGINEYTYTNWCGDENTSGELIGSIDVRGDTIMMHYTATKENFKKNGDLKNKKTEKFDVSYTQKGLEWIPSDASKLEVFGY